MKIENIEVCGWRAAIRGMRNPMDSWDKSDSLIGLPYRDGPGRSSDINGAYWNFREFDILCREYPHIGPNDLKLAKKLIKGGSEHRKFLRQIIIWCDLTLPRYVWTELDTYKVATVRNSCSTMHKLGTRNLSQEDFEHPVPEDLLDAINIVCKKLRSAKASGNSAEMSSSRLWLKNILPEGFLQKATYMMSYETALSMYHQRKNHRLPEWNKDNPESICSFIHSLPYMKEFIDGTESRKEPKC
jgi:hypothetical protein